MRRKSTFRGVVVKNFDEVWDHVPHFSWYQAAVTLYASIFAFIAGIWLIYPIFSMYEPIFQCAGDSKGQIFVKTTILTILWARLQESY